MAKGLIGVYLPVSAVFPDLQSDFPTFKSLLLSLSRTDTLFWCSRLNLAVSDSTDVDHLTKQQFGLNEFFTPGEINAVNAFVKEHGGAENVTVFFRGQLLEILRWATLLCHDQPGDGTTYEDAEVRRRFAQAALLASDIWARRVFKDRFNLEGGLDIARKRALGPSRKSVEGTSLTPNLYKSLGRGWLLINGYFPRHHEHFQEKFLSLTGLSVEDYYMCLAAIMTNFMNPKRGSGIFRSDLSGESTPYGDKLRTYISLDSQTSDELRHALWGQINRDINSEDDVPPYDYRPLREKPILRTTDGRAIILDPVFYSERATVGPIFLLTKQQSRDKANEIFSAFGNAFEEYVCDVLQRMFPDISGVSAKRLSCHIRKTDQMGNELEIDACLNDIVETVVFEIKAVWIRENEILTDDHEAYLQHLREKYIVGGESARDRKIKGLGQLVRTINLLASQEWAQQNAEFSKVELVYPMLVAYDPLLSVPVYGNFLASEFKVLLAPDSEPRSSQMRKGRLRIAPLTVMSVEDLEDLEVSIRHFGFKELLADYSQSHPDRITSLHDFIALSKYNQQMYPNRALVDAGLEILEKSQKAVFPAYIGESDSEPDAA